MTSTNLALVFGSALLKKGRFGKRESRKTSLGIDHYVASVNVVRAMIDNWDVLFQVFVNFGHTYFTALSPVHKAGISCTFVPEGDQRYLKISMHIHEVLPTLGGAFNPGQLIEMSIKF